MPVVKEGPVRPPVTPPVKESAPTSYLKDASITFNTNGDDKNPSTVVHVFVKNRLGSSLTPEQDSDFISNWLAYHRYQGNGDLVGDLNPYLAYRINLADYEFTDPSSNEFQLKLRPGQISAGEIILPVVNVHILTDGDDRWVFDYTLTFNFTHSSPYSFSSSVDGIKGIILDQDNRNHSGICREYQTLPAPRKPETDAVLKKVTLEFATNQENKNDDTRLNVRIVNRLSAGASKDLVVGLDLFAGEEFPDEGSSLEERYKAYSWSSDEDRSPGEGLLASNAIRLADMVLPVVYIDINAGEDRWAFDYRVTFEFGDAHASGQKRSIYSSRTDGIVLDQTNNKHAGVYQGRPFPTEAPPTAPSLTEQPVDHTQPGKEIPLALLREKFNELINNRNGSEDGDSPPLIKIRLDNSGGPYNGVSPESYLDQQAITALNQHPVAGQPDVAYVSSPTSLGQLSKGILPEIVLNVYFDAINSSRLLLGIDGTGSTPLHLGVEFDVSGPHEMLGDLEMNFKRFSIILMLTLDASRTLNNAGTPVTVVDVMSWVPEIEAMQRAVVGGGNIMVPYSGTFLKQLLDVNLDRASIGKAYIEQVIEVSLAADSTWEEDLREAIRDEIFHKLTKRNVITKMTPCEEINSRVTSWLLGGVADDEHNTDSNNVVIAMNDTAIPIPGDANGTVMPLEIKDDKIVIPYTGSRRVFVAEEPPDWPTTERPSAVLDFCARQPSRTSTTSSC